MAQSLDPQLLTLASVDAGRKNVVKNQSADSAGGDAGGFGRVFDQQRGGDAGAAAAGRQAADAGGKDLPGTRSEAAAIEASDPTAGATPPADGELPPATAGAAGSTTGAAQTGADGRVSLLSGGSASALPPGSADADITVDSARTAPVSSSAGPGAESGARGSVNALLTGSEPLGAARHAGGATPTPASGSRTAELSATGTVAAASTQKAAETAAALAVAGQSQPGTAVAAADKTALLRDGRRPTVPGSDVIQRSTATSGRENAATATADLTAALRHGGLRGQNAAEFSTATTADGPTDVSDLLRMATPTPRADAAPVAQPAAVATGLAAAPTTVTAAAAPTAEAGEWMPEYALEHAPEDAEFPREVTARMKLLLRDGVREARLQLHPAELGRLQVSVTTDGDQARVVFVTETAAAREAIEQSMPRLRDMLEQNGLQLAQSDVEQGDLAGRGDGGGGDDSAAPVESRQAADEAGTQISAGTLHSGLVDTYI